MMTMGLTGKVAPYKTGFGPMPGEIFHVPFPSPMLGVTLEQSLACLDTLLKADVDPARVAAIIIEPVQGEGGFYQAPVELLAALRRLCDQHGILLIADEVQTGFARTGKLFAIEHSGIEPDLITVAKSLAGGFPLSGVIGKAEIMDGPAPGGLGGTYAGSPISCAAALAVLEVIEEEHLCARANTVGAQWVKAMPAGNGLNAAQMIDGGLKAVILLNNEPEFDSAAGKAAIAGLNKAEMVVTLSPFKANLEFSDVLLPIAPFTETSGSFVNAEGRLQSFHAVVKPLAETRPAWKVLRVLANLMGVQGVDYETSQDVLAAATGGATQVPAQVLSNAAPAVSAVPAGTVTAPAVASIYQLDSIVRRATSLQLTADARQVREGGAA